MLSLRALIADARHFQIAALGTLLVTNIITLDFGARPLSSFVLVATTLLTQTACTLLWRLPRLDLRSPLITGCSLSLIFHADALWIYVLAGVLGIGSKFVIRWNGKHLFNPATFAIVILLLLAADRVWVTPGQWGTQIFVAALMTFLGVMVLQRAARFDIALAFILSYAALVFGRALWLGDPLAIPLHYMQSGALLLFTFFMITDPRSTPDALLPRLIFGIMVAILAFWLNFIEHMRDGLFFALFAMHFTVPLFDDLFPHGRFEWRRPQLAGGSA